MMEGWDIENFKKLKILLVLFLLYLTENIIFLNLIIVFGFQRYTLYGMRYTIYIFKLKTVFITNYLLLITVFSTRYYFSSPPPREMYHPFSIPTSREG